MSMEIELLKTAVLSVACFLFGMKWNYFWKGIDYSIREWVSKKWYGVIVELVVDAMHHTISAVFLIFFSLKFYPSLTFYGMVAFAAGMIAVDAPREKDRILEMVKILIFGKGGEELEEAIKKVAEGIIESALEGREEATQTQSEEVREMVAEIMKEGEE